jgi:hypothetical protein
MAQAGAAERIGDAGVICPPPKMLVRTSSVLEVKQDMPKFALTTSGECCIIPAHSRPIPPSRSLRLLGWGRRATKTISPENIAVRRKEYVSKQ